MDGSLTLFLDVLVLLWFSLGLCVRVDSISPHLDVIVYSLGSFPGPFILLPWLHSHSVVPRAHSVVSSTWKGPPHWGVKSCSFSKRQTLQTMYIRLHFSTQQLPVEYWNKELKCLMCLRLSQRPESTDLGRVVKQIQICRQSCSSWLFPPQHCPTRFTLRQLQIYYNNIIIYPQHLSLT